MVTRPATSCMFSKGSEFPGRMGRRLTGMYLLCCFLLRYRRRAHVKHKVLPCAAQFMCVRPCLLKWMSLQRCIDGDVVHWRSLCLHRNISIFNKLYHGLLVIIDWHQKIHAIASCLCT